MSLYQTQKFLYTLNRDQRVQEEYRQNLAALLDRAPKTYREFLAPLDLA